MNDVAKRSASGPLVGLVHLRALAIVLVFIYHYRLFAHPAWVDRVGAFGWTGVDLFFVLSGFLISRQLFRSLATRGTFSLREFYFKRLLRIVPAYLVVLAAYFCFPAIHERESLPPLWRFLSFTQNIGLDLRTSGTFSHAWSLCIEEQFYLVLPLAVLAFARRRRAVWIVPLLVASGLVVRALVYQHRVADGITWYEWIYYPTWSRLDGLLMGIAIGAIYELQPALREKLLANGRARLALAVVLWFGARWLFEDPQSLWASVIAFPAIALIYGLLVSAALSPSSILARSSRVTEWLATLSYALYLSHKATIHVTQSALAKIGFAADGGAMLLACATASLLVAFALHLAVERPFLRWRDRVLQTRSVGFLGRAP
ncbi:MAG: acyltransferase [Kofleriaceae bacterium]|nr:acyltransferase [Kofleriaceae bacterium]